MMGFASQAIESQSSVNRGKSMRPVISPDCVARIAIWRQR
jgi:hypothetical protein